MNEYTNISEYYDLLTTNGYYDYENMAKSYHSAMGGRKKILEVGTGTGLLLDELLKLDPSYEVTGMDHTQSMLDVAKERLGNKAKLVQANLVSMDLGDTFDVIISNGVWAMTQMNEEYHLATHLPDNEENLQALKNVARHLRPDGIFLINTQGSHKKYDVNLPGGIIYSQEALKEQEDVNEYCLKKRYVFHKDNQILAEQTSLYKFFIEPAIEKIMNEAGFKFQGINSGSSVYCYCKI
jgi:ubiquinone/menaquinone biosynthesis C-methylase UbiE